MKLFIKINILFRTAEPVSLLLFSFFFFDLDLKRDFFLSHRGEMVYILEQRLHAQNIAEKKSVRVLRDVVKTMYNPKFMAPLYEKWDNAVIKWAIDNLGIPDFSITKWYRHRQRVLAPIASGGLGLNGLQRRSHAGWLCAWSTVLDTFKSNENRHTCNIGVTRYLLHR